MSFREILLGGGRLLFFILFVAVGAHAGKLVATSNFHEIVPGEFYRSAQLTPSGLAYYVRKYHIRTVINLRGASPDKNWYNREVAVTRAMHAEHIDFRMSSDVELTDAQVAQLSAILRDAPRPILVHCVHGVNRTGLVTAMYLAQVKKVSEWVAELQMSPIYGDFSLWFLGVYAMDRTFERLEPSYGYDSPFI